MSENEAADVTSTPSTLIRYDRHSTGTTCTELLVWETPDACGSWCCCERTLCLLHSPAAVYLSTTILIARRQVAGTPVSTSGEQVAPTQPPTHPPNHPHAHALTRTRTTTLALMQARGHTVTRAHGRAGTHEWACDTPPHPHPADDPKNRAWARDRGLLAFLKKGMPNIHRSF